MFFCIITAPTTKAKDNESKLSTFKIPHRPVHSHIDDSMLRREHTNGKIFRILFKNLVKIFQSAGDNGRNKKPQNSLLGAGKGLN
jgi:hypothetical protein